jgi:hypothetical protein
MSINPFPGATFTSLTLSPGTNETLALGPGQNAPAVAARPATSRLAVAAAVCATLGFLNAAGFFAGIVLGHMALVRIKRSNGRLRGRRLALAAVIVSWTPIVLVAVVFVLMFLIGLDTTVHGR